MKERAVVQLEEERVVFQWEEGRRPVGGGKEEGRLPVGGGRRGGSSSTRGSSSMDASLQ